jgi:DNA modification methylase
MGAGTTCDAAHQLYRNSVGIDAVSDYVNMAKGKIPSMDYFIAENGGTDGKNNKKRNYRVHRKKYTKVS